MNADPFPCDEPRRKLAEIGVPRERHALGELLKILPASLDRRPYDDMTPDMVAEVVIYLARKEVLALPRGPRATRELAPAGVLASHRRLYKGYARRGGGGAFPSPGPLSSSRLPSGSSR